MNWYVFSTIPEDADESLAVFGSFQAATLEAQCRHDTTRKPVRKGPGLYRVRGDMYSSYIAHSKGMRANGFEHLLTPEREQLHPEAIRRR